MGASRKSWTAPGGASLSQADVKAPGADPGGLGADPGGPGAHGPSIEVGGGGPLIELEILRSWGASWGVLGAPGVVLGGPWRHLGVVLGILGLLGSVLGPSLDVLVASWGAFRCQFNLKAIFDRFLIDFGTRVGSREPQSELAG